MSLSNPGRERAARHAAQAQEYRRLADLLLARETAPAAAGELLYAAAKQGINAVANQQGVNPAAAAAKRRFLAAIAESAPAAAALRDNWQSAADLHHPRRPLAPPRGGLYESLGKGPDFHRPDAGALRRRGVGLKTGGVGACHFRKAA